MSDKVSSFAILFIVKEDKSLQYFSYTGNSSTLISLAIHNFFLQSEGDVTHTFQQTL